MNQNNFTWKASPNAPGMVWKTNPLLKPVAKPLPKQVRRDGRTLAQKRGWTLARKGMFGVEYWVGHFHVQGINYEGKAENAYGKLTIFIKNPPTCLRNHKHWDCFMKRGNGWFFIHSKRTRVNLSDAIFEIETILNEAFTNY